MEKKELKRQIDEVIKKIKTNSKDAHFADELTDELLSLKGQYDVEPTRLFVKESDVIKEYDFDSFRMLRCKQCIIYQVKGGYTIVVSPRMKSLYLHLNVLLDLKDRYENTEDDEKVVYTNLFVDTNWILNAPIIATSSDEMLSGIASDIYSRYKKFCDDALNAPLKDEEVEKDAEFENTNEALKIIGGEDAESK